MPHYALLRIQAGAPQTEDAYLEMTPDVEVGEDEDMGAYLEMWVHCQPMHHGGLVNCS